MSFLGKERWGVIGLGSSACKIPSRFPSESALELHLPRQIPNLLPALAADRPYSLSGYGGGPYRRLVKVPGSTPGKIPKPCSDLGKMTKSVVRYEADASDPTAVWRIVHLRPSEEPRELPDQVPPAELENEKTRSVEDLWQISLNGTQGIQSMSTPEGNFNSPPTGLSVVVTGWGEDPLPCSSWASPTWNLQSPSLEPALVRQRPQNPKEHLSQPQFKYPARQWNSNPSDDRAPSFFKSLAEGPILDSPELVGGEPLVGAVVQKKETTMKSFTPGACKYCGYKWVLGHKCKQNQQVNLMAGDVSDEAQFDLAQLYVVGRADKRLRCTGLFWKLPPWPDFCTMNCDRFAQHCEYEVIEKFYSVKQYSHSVLDYTDKFEELVKIWPFVNEAASELIKTSIESVLEQYRLVVIAPLKFPKLTLGTVAPQFTGILIRETSESGIIKELEMNWDTNPSIILDIKTRLGVALPIQRKVIGGEISVIHGNSDTLEDTIKDAIEYSITWPVRKVISIISGDYNDLELKSVGTLVVNFMQARDLTNKDVIGISDPSAILYIRPLPDKIKRSKTINNDLNSIWNEHFEFIVDDADNQWCSVKRPIENTSDKQFNPENYAILKELGFPEYTPIFIKKPITIAMDPKNREKEMASVLLSSFGMKLISTKDIVKGFIMLLESAEDTALKILDASDELGLFLAVAKRSVESAQLKKIRIIMMPLRQVLSSNRNVALSSSCLSTWHYLLYKLGDSINYLSILEAVFVLVLKIIFSTGLDNANQPLWSVCINLFHDFISVKVKHMASPREYWCAPLNQNLLSQSCMHLKALLDVQHIKWLSWDVTSFDLQLEILGSIVNPELLQNMTHEMTVIIMDSATQIFRLLYRLYGK